MPGNNNVDAREANIIVSVDGGPAAIHAIRQERPVGCVYKVSPTSHAVNHVTGGTVTFDVTTVPNDCEWRVSGTSSDLSLNRAGGTGAASVTYTLNPNAFWYDRVIQINGLSGLNPPAIYTVIVQ